MPTGAGIERLRHGEEACVGTSVEARGADVGIYARKGACHAVMVSRAKRMLLAEIYVGSFTAFADGAAASPLVYGQILPSAVWSFSFWSYSVTAGIRPRCSDGEAAEWPVGVLNRQRELRCHADIQLTHLQQFFV